MKRDNGIRFALLIGIAIVVALIIAKQADAAPRPVGISVSGLDFRPLGALLAQTEPERPTRPGVGSDAGRPTRAAPSPSTNGIGAASLGGSTDPNPSVDSALLSGSATWYCGPSSACTHGYGPSDLVAAIDPTLGIRKGTELVVHYRSRSVSVRVVDVCACKGARIIDLTSGAFSRLAPLSAGVIRVSIEVGGHGPAPELTLPPTDVEP